MNCNELLNVAEYAGKILLESGAEAYRTEETMVKICESFDVDEVQSFVMMTGVMLSITHEQQNYTKVMRIQKRAVDLNKIDAINQLSRSIKTKQLGLEEVMQELQRIDNEPRYSIGFTLFFSACSAFGFALFFQGSLVEAITSFFIGLGIKSVSLSMEKSAINPFFHQAIAAGIGALLTRIALLVGIIDSMDIVIISSIMLLVPGLAITNAIRDTVAGDYVSGLSRGVEAFLSAMAIAVGIVSVLSLWMNFMGGI